MSVLLALVLGLSRPPGAYLTTSSGRVPLAISSWCWGLRCGAPIASSPKVAVVRRGTTIRAELGFVPTKVAVAVVGHPVVVSTRGHEVSWRATRAGGLSLRAATAHGWVIYVCRVALR
jgi:hypothetical protein